MSDRSKAALLVIAATLAGVVLIELGIRAVGYVPFLYWRQAHVVNFHYHTSERLAEQPPRGFDPLLGWTDHILRREGDATLIENVSGHAWRPAQSVPNEKQKKRVVLVGDSFTYGWSVQANETIDHYLQQLLGPDFEVINLGVRGYGINQMTLMATKVAPQFKPDVVVVSFIGDDLRRSCEAFSSISRVAAPKFELREGRLIEPPPVPTPFEHWQQHQASTPRWWNAFVATALFRTRIVDVFIQPFLQKEGDECIDISNAKLLDFIQTKLKPEVTPLFVYLSEGGLRPRFAQEIKRLGISILDVSVETGRIAAAIHAVPERHPDGHPKAGLNRIYAQFMLENVQRALAK